LVDGFEVWQKLDKEAQAIVIPYMWTALVLCWLIVIYLTARQVRSTLKKS
jgi:hypothetical protein